MNDRDLDIEDPIGADLTVFQDVGQTIADALIPILQALHPNSIGNAE